ncbi:fungal-specific transcription factor domain-containing protein [Xylaria sp. CBS 124048]|nr:fungal-specific transcription factor domain-containing protein [Xylaria sp. CBS 124048]
MAFALESQYGAATGQSATEVSGDINKSVAGQRPRQQPGSACEECRRRKLRCDRRAGQCQACANSGTKCVVRSNCPPRGPKKGYIRDLQKQIEQLQSRLNEQQQQDQQQQQQQTEESSTTQFLTPPNEDKSSSEGGDEFPSLPPLTISTDIPPMSADVQCWSSLLSSLDGIEQLSPNLMFPPFEDHQLTQAPARVGLEQYLTPMICTDLDQLYFDRVHTFTPMLQKFRYLSWSKQANKTKQRKGLQYAMWTLAASLSSQFQLIRPDLYAEARQLLDSLEVDDQDHQCLEQAQAWILLAIYELTSTSCNYHRGMMSAGRAFRLIQLMKLSQMDAPNVVATSPIAGGSGHGDWIDIESKRRTFWVAYSLDRLTSAMDGLPLTFHDKQITTRLPVSDPDFAGVRPSSTCFLHEAIEGADKNFTSPFTLSIIMTSIWGRALEHRQTSQVNIPHSFESDHRCPMGEFSYRHRSLAALSTRHITNLSTRLGSMSQHPDPMLIFVALTAYTTVFMICEALESKLSTADAQGNGTRMTDSIVMENQQRSLEAVRELRLLTSTLGQVNQFQTHPFTAIPLLRSARFCLKHVGPGDAYSNLIPSVARALEALSNVNGLSKRCLSLLSLEHNEAYKLG